MARLKQIHSSVTLHANEVGHIGEGDALVSRAPGVAVSVRTADCYPILLVDTRTRVVAAVHSGCSPGLTASDAEAWPMPESASGPS